MPRTAPMTCSASLTPVAAGAVEWGFVPFNEAEHLCVDLPDHPVTITCRDSKDRTTTIHFGNYARSPDDKSPPTFIDIQHIGARRQDATGSMHKDGKAPAFEVVGFAPAASGGDPFDTRDMAGTPSLISIMCDGEEHAVKTTAAKTRLYVNADDLRELLEYSTSRNHLDADEALPRRLQAALDRLQGRK